MIRSPRYKLIESCHLLLRHSREGGNPRAAGFPPARERHDVGYMSARDCSSLGIRFFVIPAKAGIHGNWVPACAGTTCSRIHVRARSIESCRSLLRHSREGGNPRAAGFPPARERHAVGYMSARDRSNLVTRFCVIPAKAGIHGQLGSRLRGNDMTSGTSPREIDRVLSFASSSFPRRRESTSSWVPACAGTT